MTPDIPIELRSAIFSCSLFQIVQITTAYLFMEFANTVCRLYKLRRILRK